MTQLTRFWHSAASPTRPSSFQTARGGGFPFGHGRAHALAGLTLFDSYHCSRYNTNTGVLTPQMFRDVFGSVRKALDARKADRHHPPRRSQAMTSSAFLSGGNTG